MITGIDSIKNSKSILSAECVVHAADSPSAEAVLIIINGTILFLFKDTNNCIYDPFHIENILKY